MTESTEIEFSQAGYKSLLDAIISGGYNFAKFSTEKPQPGDFFLRHDVDKNVSYALKMARIEKDYGIQAHYFFLLHSPLYSLLEPETWDMVAEIQSYGHWVGLHCDERKFINPGQDFDENVLQDLDLLQTILPFAENVVSFHNPSQVPLRREPQAEYISAYDPRFFPPKIKYLSDSNMFFREGSPIEALQNHFWPIVQMLIHPLWWMDHNKDAKKILKSIFDKRVNMIDSYLTYSNHLWKN